MNETYAFIEAEKTTHGVAFLCRLLKVARSSFYAWLAAAKSWAERRAADQALVHEITLIHVGSCQTYGVPRVHAELRRLGRRVNRKRVARLTREHGIQGVTRRKRRSLTRPDQKARPAPDLIGRRPRPVYRCPVLNGESETGGTAARHQCPDCHRALIPKPPVPSDSGSVSRLAMSTVDKALVSDQGLRGHLIWRVCGSR
ncbi:IS3 family transposase [Streptomyces californicus]|uniref:IS3 family transposase n=1 Tax=Streptomyces californicus TaxID=67351 RepID=UPI0036DAF7FF